MRKNLKQKAARKKTLLKRIGETARKATASRGLAGIVQELNDGTDAEVRADLAQLVRAWQAARIADRTPFEREVDAPAPVLLKMSFPAGCPCRRWAEVEKRCGFGLAPFGTGTHPYAYYSGPRPWTKWDHALKLFVELVTNPLRDSLAGPCARCERFFVKKRESQKVYCSRDCGNAATAIARTRRNWEAQHEERLEQAKKARRAYDQSTTTEPFQAWAAKRYPGLTKHFLTRLLNNRELPELSKERSN